MTSTPESPQKPGQSNPQPDHQQDSLWCPQCHRPVADPLVCQDCSSVICRACGSPLESADELAFG